MPLEKAAGKRVCDAFTTEKPKIGTEIKNKMQWKSERRAELFDNAKAAAVVALVIMECTAKISNYEWDQ